MNYNKEKNHLKCGRCGFERDLKKENIRPRGVKDVFDDSKYQKGITYRGAELTCGNCKSIVLVDAPLQDNFICPFCNHKEGEKSNRAAQAIAPRAIAPFVFPKSQVLIAFKKWMKQSRWIHPPILKTLSQPDKILGVFVPYWQFAMQAKSTWQVTAEFEMEGQSQGGGKGRGKGGGGGGGPQKHFEHLGGYFEESYSNLQVPCSHGINSKLLEAIHPFNTRNLVGYDGRYLAGWAAEVIQVDMENVLKEADKQVNALIKADIQKLIPGKNNENLKVSSEIDQPRFRQILLPVWVAVYHYQGKPYQFIVNGQTGAKAGTKPYSRNRIIILLSSVVLLVSAIVVLVHYFLHR